MSRSDRNPHLPPWLQDVPLPPKPSEPGQDVSGAPLFSGLPEWLRDEDETDQSPTPSWLIPAPDTPESDVSAPAWAPDTSTTTFDVPAAAETSPPSWLQSLRESLVTPEAMGPEEKLAEPEPFTFASASDADAEISDAGFHSGSPADSSEAKGPSWLVDERFEQRAEETPALNASSALPAWPGIGPDESTEPVDLPAWLRELPVADDAEQKPSLASSSEIHSEDLPDWLRDLAAAPPKPPAAPPEPPSGRPAGSPHLPPASDLPDWLRDLAAAPPEPPSGRPAGSPHLPPASDLPDWLREIAAALPEPPAAPSEPPPRRPSGAPQPVSDLSDQLQTTAPLSQETPPWLESEHKQLPAAAPGDALLPDWPRGADGVLSDTRDGRSQISQPAAPQISSDLLSGTDLPDWLRGEPESKPESVPFSPPNLDDWLVRLRSATDDEVGVGALVAAPKLAPPPAPKRSEEQLRALSLLRHLAAEPIPATTPLLAPAPESVLRRVGVERLLSITLLILAIIAVAFPGIAPFLETPPVMPAVSTAHEQIAALDANDVALIGYEWDARRVGELRPLEQAVIGQLIAQNVKLILVSTDPQGTLLQFDLLDALRDAGYRQQGEGYLLLGYKPGGEIALRTLGRDFQGMLRSDYRGDDATGSALIAGIDTGRPIASLNDLSLIIVLADDTSDVQGWMEQVYPQLQTGNRPVSLVFLLPEEAAPIVQPYMRQPGVVAIAGQRGALAYMALNQGGGASEVAKAAIQHRLTILLFVVVLLFGLAISGIDAVRRRRT
ncbi:MAG: hypothetical protein RMJ54_10020 [Roseiflexaceae bacterium]|nr:hypothetical protein [Roseiflexaceae bacterium]